MSKYIVIAGAVPALNKRKVVQPNEILDEDFFLEGEIPDLLKGKFIEEYVPYVVTKADLELTAPKKLGDGRIVTAPVNEHHIAIHGLYEGAEIHLNLKNFTKAPERKNPEGTEESKATKEGKKA